MQKRRLILIAHAQHAQRLRRELQEAADLLMEEPLVDEMLHKLIADQFRELAEEVRQLQTQIVAEWEIQEGA
jgi:glutamine synthetase